MPPASWVEKMAEATGIFDPSPAVVYPTTGEILIRNYANATALRIPRQDIGHIAELIRNEYPKCDNCEGTMVDDYCTDCGQDALGDQRQIEVAEPGEHDHVSSCAFCGIPDGDCCDHCPGGPAYDPAAIRAALEGVRS